MKSISANRLRTRLQRVLAPETRGLVQDSFVLSLGTAVATVGQMVQIALMTNFLGLKAYGQFALVVACIAVASRFFDVQVGSTAVAYASKTRDDAEATSGIFRFSYLVDGFAGLAGYAVVAAIAPLIADHLVGGHGPLLFFVYGLTLLTATVETTSLAILQFLGEFKKILWVTILREILRVALLSAFLGRFDSLSGAVVALVIVETVFVAAVVLVSGKAFDRSYALTLRRARSWPRPDVRRSMLRMIFHTNFITYAKLVSSQAPTILLGAFRGPVDVGAFKVAMALAAGVGKPADPAWAAALPRLSQLWNQRRFSELRALLVQSTLLAMGILAIGVSIVLLLRSELIRIFAGQHAPAAWAVLLLALSAQVVNGALFWNSALLIAARRANVASRSYVATGLLLVVLLPVLIRTLGATGAAIALLTSTVCGNIMLTVGALRMYREELTEMSASHQQHPLRHYPERAENR